MRGFRNHPVDLRFLRRVAEATLARILVACLKLLPLDRASAFGGFVGRSVGPRLAISKRAASNLRLAFPGLDEAGLRRITRDMWDNLGRTFAEFPHLEQIAAAESGRVEVVGIEHVLPLKSPEQAGIFITGHFANWEVMARVAHRHGFHLSIVMREPNNPMIRPILARLRGSHHARLVPKGTSGARQLVATLRDGGTVALLVDQKLNSGLAAPFFGLTAMTTPAPAQLALKFRCPMVPLRLERLGGARFRLTCYPPIPLPDSGDRAADVLALTTAMNAALEDWIRERPGDWFWLHRRWPKAVYETKADKTL